MPKKVNPRRRPATQADVKAAFVEGIDLGVKQALKRMKRTEDDLRKLAVIRQTLAQESSPCARCRRKICNDPCIPHRDFYRGQRKKAAPRT